MTSQSTEELCERALVQRMLLRDNRSWQLFLVRYQRLILATIRKLVGRFPATSARVDPEDVYAAFLVSLVRNDMHKLRAFDFDKGYKLSTWMALLASHITWDHLRAAARRPEVNAPVQETAADANTVDALRSLIARDDWDSVLQTFERLSARDREFVELLYLQEASVEEIASNMGISVKTVYTKKHKIRLRMEHAAARHTRVALAETGSC